MEITIATIDVALGRGGDQIVLKADNNYGPNDIVIENVCGTGVNIIATRTIEK